MGGISIARGVKPINHSQFVDDTILLGGASSIMDRRLKSTLDDFLVSSGAMVNEGNNKIYGRNCSHLKMQEIARIMGFFI